MHCVACASRPASDVPHRRSPSKFPHRRNLGVVAERSGFQTLWLASPVSVAGLQLWGFFFPSDQPCCGSWPLVAPPAPQLCCSQPSPSRRGLWQQRAARDREDLFINWVKFYFLTFTLWIQRLQKLPAVPPPAPTLPAASSGLGCCAGGSRRPRQSDALRRATASRNTALHSRASPSGLERESCWFRRLCPVTRAPYGILSCSCWKAIQIWN